MQPVEYILSDFSLPLGGSASEFIEITVEPVIYLFVNDMIMITYLFRSLFFLESFHLSGSAVLVSTAHVERVVAHEAAIASENVCTQHTPYDVAQVGDIVHVGEGTRDQYIPLVWLREDQPCALDSVDLGVGLRELDCR